MSKNATPAQESAGTTAPSPNERGGIRPRYIALGTDREGAHHVYHTERERVIVIADGDRTHVLALDGRSVDDCMDHVAECRGWACEDYGLSIIGRAVARVERIEDHVCPEGRA